MPDLIYPQPVEGLTFVPPTPTDPGAMEDAILARLRAMIPSSSFILGWPDRPAEITDFANRPSVIQVAYLGATYDDPVSTNFFAQPRQLEFEVRIYVRSNVAYKPVYATLELARGALQGWQAPGAYNATTLADEKWISREAAVWLYTFTIHVPVMSMPMGLPDTDETAGALLKKLTYIEPGGETLQSSDSALYAFDDHDVIVLQGYVQEIAVLSPDGSLLYIRDADYSLDAIEATLTRISTGVLPANASVKIHYTHSDRTDTTAATATDGP